MGKKRFFWGVFLLLAGAYLVISKLGYVPVVGPFSIIFTIACIAIIVASIPKLEFGGILFPLAYYYPYTMDHIVSCFVGNHRSVSDFFTC